jgi:Predicted ATP-grasp enzyme
MRKRVLVYPCGTEIGLEIYRSVCNSIHFELFGGSSTYDHGRFVYKNHIDHLPFITDTSTETEIKEFNEQIRSGQFDLLYPAMDGVLSSFAKHRDLLDPKIVLPEGDTAEITRSKSLTYQVCGDAVPTPRIVDIGRPRLEYPIFAKPDVGQGSVGALKINDPEELNHYLHSCKTKPVFMEYLPGKEYTIDCFTNRDGELVYAGARLRRSVKGGISVNTVAADGQKFSDLAEKVNRKLQQRGGWFLQVKERENGELVLLEVSSRIAGTSGFARNKGVNLPLLTLFLFSGSPIDSVLRNPYDVEMDRALYNSVKTDLKYDIVYLDYDDTLVINNEVSLPLISFVYQCINRKIPVVLLTRHTGDLEKELAERRMPDLFDKIIHLTRGEEKYEYIREEHAIYIDDSYGERLKVSRQRKIPVFDTHMLECLLDFRL